MNVSSMLSDLISFVAPKNFHKTRMLSLCASLQILVSQGECTVTARLLSEIFKVPPPKKSCIIRADRLLSNEAMQAYMPQFYGALIKALVHDGLTITR